MKINIEMTVDNDAFGDGDNDDQFGYHVQTILKEVANSFAGQTRRVVGLGTSDVITTLHDGNGNTVGHLTVEGYEPPKKTIDDFFEDNTIADIISAIAATHDDLLVPIGAFDDKSKLLRFLKDVQNIKGIDFEAIITYFD